MGITGQRGNGEQEVIRTDIPVSSALRKARRVELHQHLFIIHNSHTLPLTDSTKQPLNNRWKRSNPRCDLLQGVI